MDTSEKEMEGGKLEEERCWAESGMIGAVDLNRRGLLSQCLAPPAAGTRLTGTPQSHVGFQRTGLAQPSDDRLRKKHETRDRLIRPR
jgi:hypothetical protein